MEGRRVLTTETGVLAGAGRARAALRASRPISVHLSSDKVSIWSVVTRVEGGEPLAVPVAGGPTPDLVRVCPDHLRVVAGGGAELEGLHVFVGEYLHLVIPVSHCLLPVVVGFPLGLLVDVEILSNTKPEATK